MILTGKAKEDFDKWYLLNKKHYDSLTVIDSGKINQIYKLDESCKHALIIDWFDSVGIYICLENHYKNFGYKIQDKGNVVLYDHMFAIHSRQESTRQAIIKANEIYNSNF